MPAIIRLLIAFFSILFCDNISAEQLKIITADKQEVLTIILDSAAKNRLVKQFDGKVDNTLHKQWTSRTFLLSGGQILLEFYDRQGLLINNINDFEKLSKIRFLKNSVWALRKNISYKVELSFNEGNHIVETENPKKLKEFKPDLPEYSDFEVYKLVTGQILFIDKSKNKNSATIYADLKTLASENEEIQEQLYKTEDEEVLMKKLASGDRLTDYDPNEHLLYPKYEKDVIKNHGLSLIEEKVFVDDGFFYGNLYKSSYGYYVYLEDFNQLNVQKTEKIEIGTLKIYNNLEELQAAKNRYAAFKKAGVTSEHFYQKISDRYGNNFPEHIATLVDSLPVILNFDIQELSLDSEGIDLVDEAIKWNADNNLSFDSWYPSVLAYYGQCYIKEKMDGKWKMVFDKEANIWMPEVQLKNGKPAFDPNAFYKQLFESPLPLRWIGGWTNLLPINK